jgi:hypothetical protein
MNEWVFCFKHVKQIESDEIFIAQDYYSLHLMCIDAILELDAGGWWTVHAACFTGQIKLIGGNSRGSSNFQTTQLRFYKQHNWFGSVTPSKKNRLLTNRHTRC